MRARPGSLKLAVALLAAATLAVAPSGSVARAGGYDTRQGVDQCGNMSSGAVNYLWSSSLPFYDWGTYIGGALTPYNGCKSSTSFVSSLRSMGWNIMPIWDDLQAPSGCISASVHMSSSTTTARSQGVQAANNAKAAMATYGFSSGDTVWLDIEAYTTSNSTCKAAVNAFVDGWDSVLGPLSDAGVYGSAAGSAVDSWHGLANPPNFVWIADYGVALNSVWGMSSPPNSHWTEDQRVHQYRGTRRYPYPSGCTGSACIAPDVDCVSTWVDGPNQPWDPDSSEGAETNSPSYEPTCNGTAQ